MVELLFGDSSWNAAPTGVAPDIAPATFFITDAYANNDLVGTITLLNTPDPIAVTYAITAGNTGSTFAIDSVTGAITVAVAANLVADDNYSLQVTATNSTGNDTAVQQVIVQDATAGIAITTITATNRSASAKTSEIFEIGLPTSATAFGTKTGLGIYDDNGSGQKGSVLANFQVDNTQSDLNSKRRWQMLTGIIPSIAGSATRKIFTEATDNSAPSGTSITAANILALGALSAGGVVAEFDFQGTTYSISLAEILAGSSTFSKTGIYLSTERWRDGPVCTEFVGRAAPRNAGTPHVSGDGIHVEMHCAAYKATSAAVGVGNPIIALRVDVILKNGDTDRASGTVNNYAYGLTIKRATSIADGTLITSDDTDELTNETVRYNFASSDPAATLTATGATTTGVKTWTADSGVFDTSIKGKYIIAGTGAAFVTARTSDTQITVYVRRVFAATSFASGGWRLEGVGHPYAEEDCITAWIGQKPTIVPWYGDNASAISPTTRAGMDYLAATAIMPNYSQTFAETSHSVTKLDNMQSNGAAHPFLLIGPESVSNGCGDVRTDIGGTGAGVDIGYMPAWSVSGLVKYNDDGRRKILENARHWARWQWACPDRLTGSPSTGALGQAPRVDCGTTYKSSSSMPGTLVNRPAAGWSSYDPDYAHHSGSIFAAWLVTGRLWYVRRHQAITEYTNSYGRNNGYAGSGINKTVYGDVLGATARFGNSSQTRDMAWSFRDLVQARIMAPNTARETLFNAQSHLQTRVNNAGAAFKGFGPDDSTGYYATATEPVYIKSSGSSSQATLKDGTNAYTWSNISPWQHDFNLIIMGCAREAGLTNSDWDASRLWLARMIVDVYADPDVVPEMMLGVYQTFEYDNDIFPTGASDNAALYRRMCLNSPRCTHPAQARRTPTGPVTIDNAAVGTGRTMEVGGSPFANGGAWYVGGIVYDNVGLFKITAVTDGNTIVGDVLKAFGSTTLTTANVKIPGAHPDDYAGENDATGDAYPQYTVAAARMLADEGVTNAAAVVAWMTARTGYSENAGWFKIARRN